ncbi:hypothetical protein [Streptomyces sp900116325]|uniref:hypothetical protein n=1 Tax=Streptomyces sp. 900116325 TaxID=3154295 RepID=UPI0033C7A27A
MPRNEVDPGGEAEGSLSQLVIGVVRRNLDAQVINPQADVRVMTDAALTVGGVDDHRDPCVVPDVHPAVISSPLRVHSDEDSCSVRLR